MTPSEKRRLADQLDSMALKLEGQARSNREAAGKLRESADADEASTETVLRERQRKSIVNSHMDSEHRLSLSKSQAPRDPFLKAIREVKPVGYTLNSLAGRLGISPATLHAHRKPKVKANSRPIPQGRADEVQKLTGWPADAAHWPAGITSN